MDRFNSLDFFEKCAVLRKSKYVMSTPYFSYSVHLYAWGPFFIEEYFDNKQQQTSRITVADESDLTKYLTHISLADLVNSPGKSCL